MLESIKKTYRTAGELSSYMWYDLVLTLVQASEVSSMAFQELGCARCLTPCADSGLMTKARRY
jgi:hypothetical protein